MPKKLKPGQIIEIDGVSYVVVLNASREPTCNNCAFTQESHCDFWAKEKELNACEDAIGFNCYLKKTTLRDHVQTALDHHDQ